MKKILAIFALGIGLTAHAGWITSVQSMTDKEIKTQKRSLDTYGQNPRVYLFNVNKEDGAVVPMQCIIVYTENDVNESKQGKLAPVMQCVEIKK